MLSKRQNPESKFRLKSADTRLGAVLYPFALFLVSSYIAYELVLVIGGQFSALASSPGFAAALAAAAAHGEAGAGGAGSAVKATATGSMLAGAGTALAAAGAGPAAGGGSGEPKPYGIHTMCTSNGSPYLNWQTRIMYKTYQKARRHPPPPRAAGLG